MGRVTNDNSAKEIDSSDRTFYWLELLTYSSERRIFFLMASLCRLLWYFVTKKIIANIDIITNEHK